MKIDPETVKIKEVVEEVNRHSRMLARQEELTSG
jgi:large subunit ribosomal protein L53